MRIFEEILREVASSCNKVLYSGYKNNYSDVIKAATEIYIAELQTESLKEMKENIKELENKTAKLKWDMVKEEE